MKINCSQNQQIFLGIVVYNMFKEKENYYFVEEFEKYGINAIYTKKIMGNMSDYCVLENQEKEIQKINRDNLLKELGIEEKKKLWLFKRILVMFM